MSSPEYLISKLELTLIELKQLGISDDNPIIEAITNQIGIEKVRIAKARIQSFKDSFQAKVNAAYANSEMQELLKQQLSDWNTKDGVRCDKCGKIFRLDIFYGDAIGYQIVGGFHDNCH